MATVSYGLKIINANRIFDATLRIYRAAVSYLMDIADRHYEELLQITDYVNARGKKVTAQQARQQHLERLVHATKDRPNVPYKNFDKDFYKFPSYLRRDAINTAIGKIRDAAVRGLFLSTTGARCHVFIVTTHSFRMGRLCL